MSDALAAGRAAVEQRAWADACAHFGVADREGALAAEDLELYGLAASLAGDRDRGLECWTRAHGGYRRRGEPRRAAHRAVWIAMSLLDRGEPAQAAGWLARAERLLERDGEDCAARAWLRIPAGTGRLGAGDAEGALAAFTDAAAGGDRFADADLSALGRIGRGRALIRLGRVEAGTRLLDEVMVAVTAGEISPLVSGIVYCAVIAACQDAFDLPRAREWTGALGEWCAAQPQLVPFRGACLVHRAEILEMSGSWPDALEEAGRACDQLAREPAPRAAAAAHYRCGDLHRLRGETARAAECYRAAAERGRVPQPGLALLRLDQGDTAAALAAIRTALAGEADALRRAELLGPAVDIALAAGEAAAARQAATELAELAERLGAAPLRAGADRAMAAVLLAEGDARGALERARAAWAGWEALEVPFEAARARIVAGAATRELGDDDTAALDLDAARVVLRRLGAAPELARLARIAPAGARAAGALTAREVEILGLVAAGRTNREIAAALVISEHTARRHLQNIFAKLGVASRAAATAHAYRHDLI
jgi:DNA-binding CsgD family transcriptional regulator